MAAFVTLGFYKNRAGITSTADDLRLQGILDEASETVAAYCRRRFLQQTYTEYLGGTNAPNLLLKQAPIAYGSVSVWLDPTGRFDDNPAGAFASSTLLTLGTDYSMVWDGTLGDESEAADSTKVCKSGLIRRISSVWPGAVRLDSGLTGQMVPGSGNIKVTYTAGWTMATIPRAVAGAVCDVATTIERASPYGGLLNSESWQGYSYSLANSATGGKYPQIGSVLQRLNRYRRAV